VRVSSRGRSAPLVALLAAVTLFALFAVNVMSLAAIHSSRLSIARTRRAQTLLDSIRADIVDAETGQRGFLLTGRGDYLEPFQSAVDEIPSDFAELFGIVAGDPGRQRDVRELKGLTLKKLDELRFTVDLVLRPRRSASAIPEDAAGVRSRESPIDCPARAVGGSVPEARAVLELAEGGDPIAAHALA